jgi:hypothetical protein
VKQDGSTAPAPSEQIAGRGRHQHERRIHARQFLRDVLVEDFLHGQGDDDFVAALEK